MRRQWARAWVGIAVLAATAVGCTTTGQPAPTTSRPDAGSTTPAASNGPALDVPRAVQRATVLADGRVLLTGGCTAPGCEDSSAARRSEIFDPATERIGYGPRLGQPRLSHTATRLTDGRVLVVGGYPGEGAPPTASMELVDVRAGTVTSAGSLRVARADHTATLLADGRVLIAGGRGVGGEALSSAEIVDPTSARTVAAPDLPAPRTAATAVQIGSRVLIIGGTSSTDVAVASTVYYNADGSWTAGPALLRARVKHAAIAIPGVGVLVAGGAAGAETRDRFADTELLARGASHFRPGPDLTDGRYKLGDAVALLPDGRVVIGGGPTLDIVDLATGTTRALPVNGLSAPLSFQTVSPLPHQRVLVAGGYDDAIVPSDVLRVVHIP